MRQAEDEPPVSAGVDLKNFPYTPLFRARLFGSSFHATANDSEWRAGVTLWLKSWDQVPAGSLPSDDVQLCRLAELGRDMKSWNKVKLIALHGWERYSDGRLYHKVVAEGINKAWDHEESQRNRTRKARATRLSQAGNSSVTDIVTDGNEPLPQDEKSTVTASKIREDKIREERERDAQARAQNLSLSKIPDEWVLEAKVSREEAQLEPVNLYAEAVKFLNRAGGTVNEQDRTGWIEWALKARANGPPPPDKLLRAEEPDDRLAWKSRMRGWAATGFWSPNFGPRPDQPGCDAPADLVAEALAQRKARAAA